MADLTWPAERMAKFIDVTPRRLAQLVQEGVIERAERGRYNPFTVTVAYIRWLRDQRASVDDDDDNLSRLAKEARRRKSLAEAEAAEIQSAEKKGILMLRSDALRWAKELGTHSRAVIMALKIPEGEKRKACSELLKVQLSG